MPRITAECWPDSVGLLPGGEKKALCEYSVLSDTTQARTTVETVHNSERSIRYFN